MKYDIPDVVGAGGRITRLFVARTCVRWAPIGGGTPCGRVDDPAPASVGIADLARVDEWHAAYLTMRAPTRQTLQYKRSLFYPRRLPPLDSGRLFSANIAFRNHRPRQNNRAILRNLLPPPLRHLFWRRRSRLRRASQGLLALDLGRVRPLHLP